MAREHKFVLPSGVEMVVRSLKGKDQGTITKQTGSGSQSLFDEMLADCTISLGDNKNVTEKSISRMLSNDRKFALVELRQFSLRYKEIFTFNYEWPITGGAKESQPYEVIFNKESFPVVAYKWVRDHIKSLSEEDKKQLSETTIYPVLYESYAEMLLENQTKRFKTEDNEEIEWTLSNGENEGKFAVLKKESIDANTQLRIRNPKKIMGSLSGDSKEIGVVWKFEESEIYDVEAFRFEIKDMEGSIDTSLTIQHQTNSQKQARVDLVGTLDFFFPSQAI